MRHYKVPGFDFLVWHDYLKDLFFSKEISADTVVEIQKINYGGARYCPEIDEEFIIGTDCRKECDFYNPCNGKSGRCRHLKNTYIGTGEMVTVGELLKKSKRV